MMLPFGIYLSDFGIYISDKAAECEKCHGLFDFVSAVPTYPSVSPRKHWCKHCWMLENSTGRASW